LLLLFAVLAIGAIGFNFQSNIWQRANRESMRGTRDMLASADVALADLRAAQAAYLSVGQGVEPWMARANDLSMELGTTISQLQSATRSRDAAAYDEAALAAMKEVSALDTKARDNIVKGERFLASDVVFVDGLEANRRVASEIAAAGQAEEAADVARIARMDLWRMAVDGGVLFGGLLVVMALRRPAVAGADIVPVTLSAGAAPPRQEGRDLSAGGPRLDSGIDLAGAAELCGDLARVLDERDLPALLGRATTLLGAKGLVLWVVDDTASHLSPSLAYGYPEKVIQRMGALETAADNVTSLAFRTMKVQTIRGAVDGHGAIAVPLLSASGCIGVLSAEMQSDNGSDARAAIARMIAAQLSTLVSPAAATAAQKIAQG
jgi:hypothetical protein